ncbi:ABC transporter substrate-binding protein [Pacificibacter sp. AS14]|uniref:ABC transporter substrate-binding protein n=1 Tax=Pacificibacter sp. AS14 TaxID=3135785 RepID=UPI00318181BB
MSTHHSIAFAALAAFFIATGPGDAQANDLIIAVQDVPDSLDPVTENSNVNLRMVYSLYETLVKTDYRDGGKLKPGLASEWTVIDGKTLEFKLREGVTFHNGDTLDAADVVASFAPVRRGLDENVPVESRQFFSGIDSVEIIDDMTVRIHMKANDAIALNRFASFPSHIISADAFNAAESYADFAAQAIGTGPYKLATYEVGNKVVFEAFDGYWGEPKAAADTVTFSAVGELSTRIAGLFSGQFDIITEIGADDFAQIEGNPLTAVAGASSENIRGLFYDSTNETLKDPRIRHALNLSIDRQLLADTFYAGKTVVTNGWQMPTFGDMYLADRPQPEYNVEKAKALLKEAGYKNQEIVYRVLNGYYTKQLETAQVLQSMWQEAGLNVKLEVKENWDQINEDTETRHIFDGSFTAYYPDPMGQFWRRFGPNGGRAGSHFIITPEMLALGEVLATSTDTSERRAVFAEMLDTFEADPNGAILHALAGFKGIRADRLSYDPIASEYMDLTTDSVKFK